MPTGVATTIAAMAGPIPLHLLPDSAVVGDAGRLEIGGVDVIEAASRYGTPLFIYDEAHLRARCRAAATAFHGNAYYATKAFLCRAMAKLAHEEGMQLDVSTGGELFVALQAGVPASRLVMHGNNKSMSELREAMAAGVERVVVDSFDELDRLDQLRAEGFDPPSILLRITPGVEAHTHEYLTTGGDDSKFGFTVSSGAAAEAVRRAASSGSVDLRGLHAHIGSQVFRIDSFREAVREVARFAVPFGLEDLSLGGGLGVAYVEGEAAPDIPRWAEAIHAGCEEAGVRSRIMVEPGRALVAAAAITVYRVGTIKDLPGIRTYLAVDGGMSDNPRPVLYGSGYETFLPRSIHATRPTAVRVVGKHCESGDVLIPSGFVPADIAVGDCLATPVTGAYGHSMGSNYNKVLRPAVVFVQDGDARLVVRRETYEDLVRNDL